MINNHFARGLIRVLLDLAFLIQIFMKIMLKSYIIKKFILILCTKSKPYKKTEFLHLKHLKEFVE